MFGGGGGGWKRPTLSFSRQSELESSAQERYICLEYANAMEGRESGASALVSERLASFAADFESKILRTVREKRAAGDEILQIQPVALGVRKK